MSITELIIGGGHQDRKRDTVPWGEATFVANFVKRYARIVGHLMVGEGEENCGGKNMNANFVTWCTRRGNVHKAYIMHVDTWPYTHYIHGYMYVDT